MANRFHHLYRDQRGMSLAFVATSLMAFLAATTLAIDVGMLMTARSQAQAAADAGALAGATALVFDSFTDHSASGPAVKSAISAAHQNKVIYEEPSVLPSDVEFLPDPSGEVNRVRVTTYRTKDRGNPMPSLMAVILKIPFLEVRATATAEAAPANAQTCVKPFSVPDRWKENQDPKFNPITSTFDYYDNKGVPLAKPDQYVPPGPGATGWDQNADKGTELVLKASNNSKITPSWYNPWDQPGSVGGDDYRDNIAGCNPGRFPTGYFMPPETGNMVGPTNDGMDLLIAKDPSATWDPVCKCVNSKYGNHSPRVIVIPLYDPKVYADGKKSGKGISLQIVNYFGFFVLPSSKGGEVRGIITPVTGVIDPSAAPAPAGSFVKAIRLIQ